MGVEMQEDWNIISPTRKYPCSTAVIDANVMDGEGFGRCEDRLS